MTLADIRVNIDRVDGEIKRLFQERMALSDQVAQVKAETGDRIFKPEREALIIEKQSADIKPEFKKEYISLVKRIIAVSREYQYGRMLELCDGRADLKLPGKEPEKIHLTVLPEHNRIKCMFMCQNRSGALADILSIISDYGINLTEIYTCRNDDQNYEFYIEMEANLLDREVRALIFQLMSETEKFRILESYSSASTGPDTTVSL